MAPIAAGLGTSLAGAVAGVLTVAGASLYAEFSNLAAQRGVDLRDYTLVAFGGAGPLLACVVAGELGIGRVLIPLRPGTLCAMGALSADVAANFVRSLTCPLDGSAAALAAAYASLQAEAAEWLEAEAPALGAFSTEAYADMRYVGQSFEIEVALKPAWIEAGDLAAIARGVPRYAPAHLLACRSVRASRGDRPAHQGNGGAAQAAPAQPAARPAARTGGGVRQPGGAARRRAVARAGVAARGAAGRARDHRAGPGGPAGHHRVPALWLDRPGPAIGQPAADEGAVIDNILLGVLNAYFRAAAEAAGFTLKRSAHTTYVKESNDFTTALLTTDGQQFAYPVATAAQTYVGIDYRAFIDALAPWQDGDIGISNCPFLTKGVSTHLPDYHMLKPVFVDGTLAAFVWCFIHSSDMGGIVAGSILPTAYELYQEGVRIPPTKLFRAGELQPDVRDFMLANVRIPEKNWGDLNAMVAACGTGDARIKAAAEKWGLDTVLRGQRALIGYGEARARALLDTIPDGTWQFHDYLEDDVATDIPVRVKLAMTKTPGGNIHLDFTGSDPQIGAAFNLASNGHHPFLCGGLLGFIRTLDPGVPINGGLLRPIRITAPEGSIVNATFPAACGVRYAINQLVYGIIQGILAQALPGQVPAAGAAQATIPAVSIMDPRTGKRRASVVQPMIGGSGARPDRDGIDATDFSLGALANTPTEAIENEVPLLIRHYGIVPDSGGPGRFRGGLAARLDFEVFQPDSILTARGMDRYRFQPWGLNGGRAGATGDAWLNPGTQGARQLGKVTMLRLGLDEVFSVSTPAGGGYGDPLTRDPALVLADLRAGTVTPGEARDSYGVVLTHEGDVDTCATQRLREGLTARGNCGDPGAWPAQFDAGPARAAHDRLFPPPVADRATELLFTLPAPARSYAKQQLVTQLRGIGEQQGRALELPDVATAWAELLPRLGLHLS